jgi:hypothetical protein
LIERRAELEKIDLSSDYDKYISYLESDIWAEKRNKALERDKYHCSICGNPNNLEVHHLRYPDVLGTELISDLMTLCRSCHKNLEDYKKNHNVVSKTVLWHAPVKHTKHWIKFKTREDYIVFKEKHPDFFDNKYEIRLYIYLEDEEKVKSTYVSEETLEYLKTNSTVDYKAVEEWDRY